MTSSATSGSSTPISSASSKNVLKPPYLSGRVHNKHRKVPSGPRTSQQKKRDWKTGEVLRKSAKIESEWIEKYSISKYGAYTPPATTAADNNNNNNNNNNNKSGKAVLNPMKKQKSCPPNSKKNTNTSTNNNNSNNAGSALSTAPNFHEMEVDFDKIVVDVCLEMLLTLDESWEGRVMIVQDLVVQLIDPRLKEDIFAVKVCKFLCALGHQFTDPRSLVIQAMLDQLTVLVTRCTQRILFFIPYIIKELAQTWMVRIHAVRTPGVKLGTVLVHTCQPLDTEDNLLLRAMFDLLQNKHADIRAYAADHIDFLLHSVPVLEAEDATDTEKLLWQDIDAAIQKCIRDASSTARMNGYRALGVYQRIAPNAAATMVAKLTRAQIKKFTTANNDLHYT